MKAPAHSASRLACDAIGLIPVGIESDEQNACCLCGSPVDVGDRQIIFTAPSANFMDDFSMASRSGIACGYCAAIMPKKVMFKLQAGVFGHDGAYSLRKDTDRAWLLRRPPRTPFVAVVSDSTLQHLIWRTPVTLSSDLITIRLGPRLLTIRRHLALEMTDAVIAEREQGKRVFRALDRGVKDLRHGQITWNKAEGIQPETRALLARASPGELWALATLAKAITPEPIEPDPILAD